MSGPTAHKQVHNRDAESFEYRHIKQLRRLADHVEDDGGIFATETRDKYPDLTDADRSDIATLMRAKADQIESHMEAIDKAMSDNFSGLVHDVEWVTSMDYSPGAVAEAWDDYPGSRP